MALVPIGAAIAYDHPVKWEATPVTVLVTGERRLDAGVYLSDGYGRRLAVEGRPSGWSALSTLADVTQPSRLTGVLVGKDVGIGYLAAGQVFEAHPSPRRWMAVSKIGRSDERFVHGGTLLVSRSGNVGRVTMSYSPHRDRVISDDLLRVQPRSRRSVGWLYGYMRTPFFKSMATTSNYGHIIKHIESWQLAQLPVIDVSNDMMREFNEGVKKVFEARDQANDLLALAESRYLALWQGFQPTGSYEAFSASAGELVQRRRRLDGYYHNPIAVDLEAKMPSVAARIDSLSQVTVRIFAPGRFSRAFGETGMPYRSAEELFDLNAPVTKRIYAGLVENRDEYILHEGWIVMACSGQIYGLNGSVKLLGPRDDNVFGTHDLIRILPNTALIRPGYLVTVLSHPTLGRPLVIRHAYGTSIPHLDVMDIEVLAVPRFEPAAEGEIADAVERAAELQSYANDLEDELTHSAEHQIQRHLNQPV